MFLTALFVVALFIPLIVLFPNKLKGFYSLIITTLICLISVPFAISVITNGSIYYEIGVVEIIGAVAIETDYFSAFFILLINLICLVVSIYSIGYFKHETSSTKLNIHFIFFALLQISTLLVCTFQNLIVFLIFWEIMSISAFMLIFYESEKKEVMNAAITFIVQMHIGLAFMTVATIWLGAETGQFTFSALKDYFSMHENIGMFLLFFVAFGMKAGFFPIHSWLPQADSLAPDPVAAIMSGVTIKMGIYGLIRIISNLQNMHYELGFFLIIISLITSIFGIVNASMQNDIRKTLAYSSIENIGIIGLGLGLGLLGIGVKNDNLAFLGFTGAVFHVFNHAIFKSLLFLGSGAIYSQTNSTSMLGMGGLIKKMPVSAIIFLVACLTLCGLPPFNGFISEFLIYDAIIGEFNKGNVSIDVLLLVSLLGMTLIGGISLFCFTRVFGMVYLGTSRNLIPKDYQEPDKYMLLGQVILVVFIIFISFAPPFFLDIVIKAVHLLLPTYTELPEQIQLPVSQLSKATLGFMAIAAAVYALRNYMVGRNGSQEVPTWGCGYTNKSPRIQYTSDSFSESLEKVTGMMVKEHVKYKEIDSLDLFPANRDYQVQKLDIIERGIVSPIVSSSHRFLKTMALFKSGQTQSYVLYAFIFMIILFILTFTNLI